MKKLEKLWGFRTNKLWKKIVASLYYLVCLIFIILSLNSVPEIKANLYDMIIYKVSNVLFSTSFLIPMIFISNFKFKDKIPLLKKKKWWSDLLGFIIIFLLIFSCSHVITLFHSKDYKQRYEEYNTTKMIYQNQESDEVPKDDKSSLTEGELEDNFKDLTIEEKNESNISEEKKEEPIVENKDDTVLNNNEITQIKIHYIDVEQGDSIFIELPNNSTMLIDAGESSKGQIVANYIKALGYSKIDYLVGTHPHTDHIGGLAYVINNFSIGSIYMPKAVSTSKTYENLLNNISQKNLKVITAKAGVNILSDNNLKIDIIAPNSDSYSELNNYSAVIKIIYENRKFLFMGDAETKSENEITSDVSADVIKIGHHGSDTSSGSSFVNKVKAKYAIITVGNNNRYGHPYQTIIDRWISSGATIYRTDLNGNIVVMSDGNSLSVSSSK